MSARGAAQQAFDFLWVVNTRKLHEYTFRPLSLDDRFLRSVRVDTPPDDLHRLLERLGLQLDKTGFIEGDAVGRRLVGDLKTAAKLGEDLIRCRRVSRITKRDIHPAIFNVQATEADPAGAEFLTNGFRNTFKPLPGDNLHVNPKQEVRAALKVKAKIDLLAGKNTAGPTFAGNRFGAA